MAFDLQLALAGICCELAVLVFLVRNKVWRTLPIFSAWMVWTVFSDAATLYLEHHSTEATFAKYFLGEVSIDSTFQFCVLVELAWSVLRPVRASLPKATPVVIAFLLLVAGVVIWPLATKTVPPGVTGYYLTTYRIQGTFAILRVVCFLLMASFSQILSIGWRDRELQVATGLGFYSVIGLVVAVMHSHQADFGEQYVSFSSTHWLDFFASAGYFCSLLYWVYAFSTAEQERREFSPQMQQLLLQLGGGARAGRLSLSGLPKEGLEKKG